MPPCLDSLHTTRNPGTGDYAFRYYDPGSGRWVNRDPIGERGGLNILAYCRNSPSQYYDYLGLEERDCKFEIFAGHGSKPKAGAKVGDKIDPDPNSYNDSGTVNEMLDNALNPIFDRTGCGDRVGAVSCWAGNINDLIPPEKRLAPGGKEPRDDPNIPDEIDGKPNPKEPGQLWKSQAEQALRDKIKAAEKQAKNDCNDPNSCCRSITIKVSCKGEGGKKTDFSRLFEEHQGVKGLCNYENTIQCNE